MEVKEKTFKMGFTEQRFPAGTHMCMLYSDEAERRRVIGRYLESGLADGEKVAYFVDIMKPEEARAWLLDMGVKLPGDDSFTLAPAAPTYCPGGKFIPDQMLDGLKAFSTRARTEGYSSARASGEMTWALRGIPGSERLMEYEALLNEVFITHPVTGLCQYDVSRFSGADILNVLKVHPMMIVGGQIVQNPYYMKPREFLKEFLAAK